MTDIPLWRRFLGVPRTRLGWWSFALALLFFVLLKAVFVWGSQAGHDRRTFFSDPIMGGILLAAAACGVSTGVTSGLGIFWKRERSFLVFITLALGAFVAYFVSGTIASGI
jgi:hypothetical protein